MEVKDSEAQGRHREVGSEGSVEEDTDSQVALRQPISFG